MTEAMKGAPVFAVMLALCLASSAQAQDTAPSTEHVTVTSDRMPPEKAVHDFISSYTAASPTLSKVTRWHAGVCPGVTGLPPSWSSSVVARLRVVASAAGAPVAKEGCRINIDIVFTRNPQALLDGVRDAKPFLLGYHDVAQEKRLATVSHAVQAWYMTQTVDAGGASIRMTSCIPRASMAGRCMLPMRMSNTGAAAIWVTSAAASCCMR